MPTSVSVGGLADTSDVSGTFKSPLLRQMLGNKNKNKSTADIHAESADGKPNEPPTSDVKVTGVIDGVDLKFTEGIGAPVAAEPSMNNNFTQAVVSADANFKFNDDLSNGMFGDAHVVPLEEWDKSVKSEYTDEDLVSQSCNDKLALNGFNARVHTVGEGDDCASLSLGQTNGFTSDKADCLTADQSGK